MFAAHLDDFLQKKNRHTFVRSAIEFDESENIQDIFNDKKITGTKTDVLRRLRMKNVDIFYPFGGHSEYVPSHTIL